MKDYRVVKLEGVEVYEVQMLADAGPTSGEWLLADCEVFHSHVMADATNSRTTFLSAIQHQMREKQARRDRKWIVLPDLSVEPNQPVK